MEPLIYPAIDGHCILSPFYRSGQTSSSTKPSGCSKTDVRWTRPKALPIRTKPKTRVRDPAQSRLESPFLARLPLEIRLQIYEYIHADHPITRRDLGGGLPSSDPKPLNLKLVCPDTSDRQLLPSDRPLAYIPSALLQTCRQIYCEARTIPLQHNEFVFTASLLFTMCTPYGGGSGLAAACAFAGPLARWQRESMQWVRLEVSPGEGDLGYKSFGCRGKWAEICGYWALGLRGLRLKIDGSRIDLECAGWGWASEGLSHLQALRWLELVLVSEAGWYLEGATRAEWVEEVETRVNAGRPSDQLVTVKCCEEVSKSNTVPEILRGNAA